MSPSRRLNATPRPRLAISSDQVMNSHSDERKRNAVTANHDSHNLSTATGGLPDFPSSWLASPSFLSLRISNNSVSMFGGEEMWIWVSQRRPHLIGIMPGSSSPAGWQSGPHDRSFPDSRGQRSSCDYLGPCVILYHVTRTITVGISSTGQ